MAKRPPRTIEGSSSDVSSPDRTYEEDKKYEVKLVGVTEYPPGTGNFLSPNDYVELSGRALNRIKDRVLEAKETTGYKQREFIDEGSRSRKTNLMSVKNFKA